MDTRLKQKLNDRVLHRLAQVHEFGSTVLFLPVKTLFKPGTLRLLNAIDCVDPNFVELNLAIHHKAVNAHGMILLVYERNLETSHIALMV